MNNYNSRHWGVISKVKLMRLVITINFAKMKKDNVSQLGDYDLSFCEQQYIHGSCLISLFKFKSFGQLITPSPPPAPFQTASNFRHLLSCSTIEIVTRVYLTCTKFFTKYINLFAILKPFSSISEEPYNFFNIKFCSNFVY